VTFAGTGTYISLAGQQITVDPITESDISDLTHTTDQVGTLNSGDLCVNDGSSVNCTVNTEAELETALDATNVIVSTEIDSYSELNTIVADQTLYATGQTDVALADGGTGASLADPNADRIMFWDDGSGNVDWLTAGTGLTLSGLTLTTSLGTSIDISDETNLTAGDALTLNDDDLDFDGGTAPAGELGGSWASPTVDSTHSGSAHHSAVTVSGTPNYITLSGQDIVRGTVDISDDTNLAAGTLLTLTDDTMAVSVSTLTVDNFCLYRSSGKIACNSTGGGGGISNVVEDTTPQLGGILDLNGFFLSGSGTVFQYSGDTDVNFTLDAGTGEYKFSDTNGDVVFTIGAVDTTNDGDVTLTGGLIGGAKFSKTIPRPITADDGVPLFVSEFAIDLDYIYCETYPVTAATVSIWLHDESGNATETIVCSNAGTSDDGSIANGTFTANEPILYSTRYVGSNTISYLLIGAGE
jgi:hypothetical protein